MLFTRKNGSSGGHLCVWVQEEVETSLASLHPRCLGLWFLHAKQALSWLTYMKATALPEAAAQSDCVCWSCPAQALFPCALLTAPSELITLQ